MGIPTLGCTHNPALVAITLPDRVGLLSYRPRISCAGQVGVAGRSFPLSIKIIYLLGLGHSGTTLLGRLLGAHSDLVATGGTRNIPLFVRGRKSCSCGAIEPDGCPFWPRVDCALRGRGRSLATLECGHDDQKRLRHQALTDYFTAVLEASGASVIVDTSRRRTYFSQLEQNPDLDLIRVHLFKDPRRQHSSSKRKGRSLRHAILTYVNRGRRVRGMRPRGRPVLHLSYEHLCSDPGGQVKRIMQSVGLEFQQRQLSEFGTTESHILGGNRQRAEKSSTIRLDESWKWRLSSMGMRLAMLFNGRRYRKNLSLTRHGR